MQKKPDVLWLSVSPYLKCFDQRLLSQLIRQCKIHRWQYCQTVDEPCSVDAIVEALHDYLGQRAAKAEAANAKVHLIGHGVSGIVGLLYARRYPQYVASLSLLSVSALPAVNWQAHYYALRSLLPCSRDVILGQMTRLLFGQQPPRFAKALAQLLSKDLDSNLTLHSLAHRSHIPAGGVEVPLLVCNGEIDDMVVSQQQADWSQWLKADDGEVSRIEDRIWHCPDGRHFFHFYHAKSVAKVILGYWAQLALLADGGKSARNGDAITASNSTFSPSQAAQPSSVSWC